MFQSAKLNSLSLSVINLFLFCNRFLATGDAITTIAISYCIGITTAWKIIFEVSAAIWNILSPEHLQVPNKIKWTQIAEDYNNICQFPNCVGAIDGKHVGLQAPYNSGSDIYNYNTSIPLC